MKLLIEYGSDVTKTQGGGFNALHEISHKVILSTAKILVEAGIDVSVKTDKGKSALDYAEEGEYRELADFLTPL